MEKYVVRLSNSHDTYEYTLIYSNEKEKRCVYTRLAMNWTIVRL